MNALKKCENVCISFCKKIESMEKEYYDALISFENLLHADNLLDYSHEIYEKVLEIYKRPKSFMSEFQATKTANLHEY
jgi:hypothetical protein